MGCYSKLKYIEMLTLLFFLVECVFFDCCATLEESVLDEMHISFCCVLVMLRFGETSKSS